MIWLFPTYNLVRVQIPRKAFVTYNAFYLKIIRNSYNMGTRDLPDIYTQARGRGHIYQENPEYPRYNYFRHSKNLPKVDFNISASIIKYGST